jgi:hypothetical protein
VLPFASEETLQRLEHNIASSPSVTEMMHQGRSARDITAQLLDGFGATDVGFSLTPRCDPPSMCYIKGNTVGYVAAHLMIGLQSV